MFSAVFDYWSVSGGYSALIFVKQRRKQVADLAYDLAENPDLLTYRNKNKARNSHVVPLQIRALGPKPLKLTAPRGCGRMAKCVVDVGKQSRLRQKLYNQERRCKAPLKRGRKREYFRGRVASPAEQSSVSRHFCSKRLVFE